MNQTIKKAVVYARFQKNKEIEMVEMNLETKPYPKQQRINLELKLEQLKEELEEFKSIQL